MTIKQTLILADDLTGANDTAIQFVKEGLSALVLTNAASTEASIGYDVVSINSNSRGMNPDDAYRVVYDTVKELKPTDNEYFVYKKVDSVLRGNPGQELAAVMTALDLPFALVAPSFPANRSVMENGLLSPNGDTSSGAIINAVKIFAEGAHRKTENIPLQKIRQGADSVLAYIKEHNDRGTEIFVADAVTDSDLEIIFETSSLLEKKHILTGSAALAKQAARYLGASKEKKKAEKHEANAKPALIIAGTRQRATAEQLLAVSDALKVPIIRFNTQAVLENKIDHAIKEVKLNVEEHILRNSPLCIIAVEAMFEEDNEQNYDEGDSRATAIATALGKLGEDLLKTFRFSFLLCTGGDTAMRICKQVNTIGIEPLEEICPGIPLGRIKGGECDGYPIITKSGRFGNKDTALHILKYMGVINE